VRSSRRRKPPYTRCLTLFEVIMLTHVLLVTPLGAPVILIVPAVRGVTAPVVAALAEAISVTVLLSVLFRVHRATVPVLSNS
jgi:hypothetical protein